MRELAMIAIALQDEERSARNNRRRFWVHKMLKARHTEGEFWQIQRHLLDDEEKFYIYFHMDRYLFDYILSFIEKDITKKNTKFRLAVTPIEKIAVTLR
ncbi:hypothetical protein EVAR_88807_1 [Eumeta japonica]|uniref:Uncharacterized protein n=1 Tax=Eumeta variegata TaxID=151549 RepID=A0A4C1YFP7_EUMVA|nr:hypothetical protein EVAR_88807_1 [Eumeta japonica]